MKGIETLPLQLVASAILIAVVVSVGWYEIQSFLNFKAQKDFKESMVNIYQSMKDLQSVADEGAFTGVVLNIPLGWKIEVDLDKDELIGKNSNDDVVYTIKVECIDIVKGRDSDGKYYDNDIFTIPSSVNELRLVYGDLTNLPKISLMFENKC